MRFRVTFNCQMRGNIDQIIISVSADNQAQAKFLARQELARKIPFSGIISRSEISKIEKMEG